MFTPFAPNALDSYKYGHREMYPDNTQMVVSNFTPRHDRHSPVPKPLFGGEIVWLGMEGAVRELVDMWNETFFKIPKGLAISRYKRRAGAFTGEEDPYSKHLEDLHDLGYLPLVIKALPEGSIVPVQVPTFVIYNTDERFFWLPNYLETWLSAEIWHTTTNASIARAYYKIFSDYAYITGTSKDFVLWQGHDFSLRGLDGVTFGAKMGFGHLAFFAGTDSPSAVDWLEHVGHIDGTEQYPVAGSVPACYDGETEVLTDSGFKLFSQLDKTELVAQYHENGEVTFVAPTAYYDCPYEGNMIHFKAGVFGPDLLVTPNHKMVRFNKTKDELQLFEAGSEDYFLRVGYSNKSSYLVSGKTTSQGRDFTDLDRLRIAFQADGSFASRKEKYTGARTGCTPIRFSLAKDRKIQRLVEILDRLGFEYTKSERYPDGKISFWIKSSETFEKGFGWINLDEVSADWAREFTQELQYWDGCVKNNCIVYSSIEESCIDKIQALIHISGGKAKKGRYSDLRTNYNREEIFTLTIQPNKTEVSGENTIKSRVPYNGRVYCVSVPTKMLIVRRNGSVAVCGNTEHSVMTCGGEEGELEMFRRVLTKFPSGVVSIVADSFDFWRAITEYARVLKPEIMGRKKNAFGLCKTVFRPDSCRANQTPADIICGKYFEDISFIGDPEKAKLYAMYKGFSEYKFEIGYYRRETDGSYVEFTPAPEEKGAVQCLWDEFGGTYTNKGYKLLDEHVGLIYGDSITITLAAEILHRLEKKGFASGNVVLGIGLIWPL